MTFIVFKTKEPTFLEPPSFVPSGTLEIEANGTYNVANKEFVNVLVQNKMIEQVAISNVCTWVLTKAGDLYGCGRGQSGEQGNGGSSDILTFTKRMTNVKKVFCSRYTDIGCTTWALKKDGTLWGTGYATYGQQSDDNINTHNVYSFTQRLTDVKDAFVYSTMTWALKNDDSLWGTGDNTGGQMGIGSTTPERVGTFRKIMDNVKKAQSFGYRTGFVLKTDGTLWNFGSGSAIEMVRTPTQRLSNVVDFAVPKITGNGSYSNCWAVRTDGTLWGCGVNSYGQQGNGQSGSSSSYNVKYLTQRLTNVKSVACSGLTTWAIKNDDTLWGCGEGVYGQQGSGDTKNVLTFTQRMTNVKKVDCENDFTFALKNDGTLWSCGRNDYGQQGISDTSTYVKSFTQRMTDVKDFYLSDGITWVLKNDGTLWGTGRNTYGQQSSGNTTTVKAFTQRTFG